MATTTAKVTLASSDLLSDTLNLVVTSTLTAAGGTTGLTQSTGVGRKATLSTTIYTLFLASDYTDGAAHKIYLLNTSTTASQWFIITIGSQEVGKLYAGDWCFIPWNGALDFKITSSVATIMTLEHCILVDNPTS